MLTQENYHLHWQDIDTFINMHSEMGSTFSQKVFKKALVIKELF